MTTGAMIRGSGPLIMLLCVASCTDAGLEVVPTPPRVRDDRLAVAGELCTVPPENRTLPLRVLFLVDGSQSIEVSDPADPVTGESGRERAVRETWERLLAGAPEGVRFGIVRFSSMAGSTTQADADGDGIPDSYFTSDLTLLASGTQALRSASGRTNFGRVLDEASFELRTELSQASQDSLPLSKYVVIFLSDGLPDEIGEDDRDNRRDAILDGVKELRELADIYRVGDFRFHTVYLTDDDRPSFGRSAEDLLKAMAEVGGGTYRAFGSGEPVNFLFVDFNLIRRVFTLKAMSVVNLNAILDKEQIPLRPEAPGGGDAAAGETDAAATDGGQVDQDAGMAETDGDAGETVAPPPPPPARSYVDRDGDAWPSCGEHLVDTDADGAADLLEQTIGTDALVPDSDDDGLADGVEWSFRDSGFDPKDPADARCFIPNQCIPAADGYCACIDDIDADLVCDCVDDPEEPCLDELGHDCLDRDLDGFCDCPDRDGDGRCDYPDRDNDGMNGCTELSFGTAAIGVDTDADGFPDPLEVRFRSDPADEDGRDDLDWDRTRNDAELLANGDLWCDDSGQRSETAVRYSLVTLGQTEGSTCYSFDVTNITLVPTLPNPSAAYPGNGWNRVLVYAGEVPFDDPNAFAFFRVACVMAAYEPNGNLKSPASGRVILKNEDFVAIEEFDADTHCIWP